MPPTHKVFNKVVSACRNATQAGLYCFDDMFVWAHELLDRHPDVASALRDRFPIVFIDEVQDNSELQSAFLHRLFVAGQSSPVAPERSPTPFPGGTGLTCPTVFALDKRSPTSPPVLASAHIKQRSWCQRRPSSHLPIVPEQLRLLGSEL
ncbi:UvrD-helicase domain-containing protein (plasmid) [Rhizobium leguminosarum]